MNWNRYNIQPSQSVIKSHKDHFEKILNSSIEHVQDVGIKKREWKHVLLQTHPAILWSMFLASLTFAFWLGQRTADKGYPTTKQQPASKNDSLHKK